MMQVRFKNLDRSDLVRQAVIDRIFSITDKFPYLHGRDMVATVEMQNSPRQAGPDVFTIKLQISGGRYKGLRIEKSAGNLYVALAELTHHLLERLNRHGEKSRTIELKQTRILRSALAPLDELNEGSEDLRRLG